MRLRQDQPSVTVNAKLSPTQSTMEASAVTTTGHDWHQSLNAMQCFLLVGLQGNKCRQVLTLNEEVDEGRALQYR